MNTRKIKTAGFAVLTLAALFCFTSCGNKTGAGTGTGGNAAEQNVTAQGQSTGTQEQGANAQGQDAGAQGQTADDARTVSPLPQNISAATLTDATVRAAFDAAKAGQTADGGYSLTIEAFEEVCYDAAELGQLQTGDRIVTEDGTVTEITSLEITQNGEKKINGGAEAGGITLWPAGGGIYIRKEAANDLSVYESIGTVTLPLAENCLLTDNADLDNRNRTVTAAELQDYLSSDTRGFVPYNTSVRVESGKIVEIERFYTP